MREEYSREFPKKKEGRQNLPPLASIAFKLTGERPSDRYFKEVSQLADMIVAGGFEDLAEVPRQEILMAYESK